MINIIPITALRDNYIWMFGELPFEKVWVVDPGEAQPVIQKLQSEKLTLAGILLTHHHADHSAGIAELLRYAGNIPVYGSRLSPIASVNHHVTHHDEIDCGNVRFKVIAIPGHTHDHTAYYAKYILFCGDTLFSAGCGRNFEGTTQQLYASLQLLMQLPDDTAIYCGHEYTLNNLRFAKQVDPANPVIDDKIIEVTTIRAQAGCTLPSQLGDEKHFNPFLRCDVPAIIQSVQNYCGQSLSSPVETFAYLRAWKNNFS